MRSEEGKVGARCEKNEILAGNIIVISLELSSKKSIRLRQKPSFDKNLIHSKILKVQLICLKQSYPLLTIIKF